ncbi:hypothetical protein NQ315_005188 [Exocentrus adspersus]|uniref:Uncharacterized protein n=1 Tax=Exocentrus adspersus TaxID=1586481 RepID=A0AAV8VTX9_9CUCU|nr:hypothetical protein NQ315_005188 [Exocentrus adspersus]
MIPIRYWLLFKDIHIDVNQGWMTVEQMPSQFLPLILVIKLDKNERSSYYVMNERVVDRAIQSVSRATGIIKYVCYQRIPNAIFVSLDVKAIKIMWLIPNEIAVSLLQFDYSDSDQVIFGGNMDKVTEIKDSYFVSYAVFYSMGVLTFVPAHFFTIATDYWMFKFRDPFRPPPPGPPFPPTPQNPSFYNDYQSVMNPDGIDNSGPARDRTPLQASFTSSFFITCQVSMLGFLVVTALFSKKLPPPTKRIKAALLSMLVLFLINTSLTKINTDSSRALFLQ